MKRAIALTIERTAKEVRLTTDTEILRELLSRLDQDRESEFCARVAVCFANVLFIRPPIPYRSGEI